VSKLTPTPEQEAIIEAFTADRELRVQAGAGSGKTSTLQLLAKEKLEDSGLYIAYNRAIRDEAQQKFPFNVEAVTSHSLAFRAVGQNYKHRLNGPRVNATQTAKILGVTPFRVSEERPLLNPYVITGLVNETVRKFTYSADTAIGEQHVPEVTGYTAADMAALRPVIAAYAVKAWADISSLDGKLRFEHDHYLKLWAMSNPKLPGDFLFLDEAQDANPCLTGIVQNQTHMQRISVGDSSQSLYRWRGAKDALRELPGEEYTLSQSFRFGQPIADEANQWLHALDAPIELTGFDAINSEVHGQLYGAKTILCRTNMGCMSEAMTYMQNDKKVAVVGGADAIERLAKACLDLKENGSTVHPELIAFDSWEAVSEYAEEKQGEDLKPMVDLVNRFGPKTILYATRRFVDESVADVIVSTGHKAKGREWPSVRIGEDFHKEPDAETGVIEVSRDFAMLAYVSVTRAREQLGVGGLDWFVTSNVMIED
jgi:hypothetical protein